jgi:transcriptional regulator with XRE-family HTH domain
MPNLDRVDGPRRDAAHAPTRARARRRSRRQKALGRPDYAARTRALRTARGWTQEELAAQLGVSAASVPRWESGRYAPRARVWARLEALEQGKAPPGPGLSARETRLVHVVREMTEAIRDDLMAAGDRAARDPVLKRKARLLRSAERVLTRLEGSAP